MEKIISLSKKFADNKFRGKTPDDIYNYLIHDSFGKQMVQGLGPFNSLKLCFLTYLINLGKEPVSALKFVESNIFAFKTMEVNTNFTSDECDDCYGQASEDCHYCNNGQSDCNTCDGTGEDEDGDSCGECDGDGTLSCEWCDGTGTVDCQTCDGTGEIEDYDTYEVTIYEYASVNNKLFQQIELVEVDHEIGSRLLNQITKDPLTILLSSDDDRVSSERAQNASEGETILVSMTNEKLYGISSHSGRISNGFL